jgi:hypothetical protein
VLREEGIHDLRHDRVFVSDDSFEKLTAASESSEQIGSELILY